MDLLKVVTIEEALRLLTEHFKDYPLGTETVPVYKAAGRYLACDIHAAEPVPGFRRSTKDGYAVRSRDVSGASETLPAFLRLKGEVAMGASAPADVGTDEAVYVPTGGMVPGGADAVVMIEYTEPLSERELCIYRAVRIKENVIAEGEDVAAGQKVLSSGRRLGAADIGVLTSVGLTGVEVFKKPSAAVISTGDEIVAPDKKPLPGQVRDINSYTIAAAAEALGFEVLRTHVAGDDESELIGLVKECRDGCDITLLSGGSSVGKKDYSVPAIKAAGDPGILCHGLAFKPGKPTIIADAGGRPLIGLPGHPVSAFLVFGILGRKLASLMNRSPEAVEARVTAVLTENVAAAAGRESWQPVRLEPAAGGGYEARPVHGESGLISVLSEADGILRIPLNSEGVSAGSEVEIFLTGYQAGV